MAAKKKAAKKKAARKRAPGKAMRNKGVKTHKVGAKNALTTKQELYAQTFIVNKGHGSGAYREAYEVGDMTPNSIAIESSRLQANPKVAQRIRELRTGLAEAAGIDQTALLHFYLEERDMALGRDEPQHATKATTAIADLLGYSKQRIVHEAPQIEPMAAALVKVLRKDFESML